MNATNGTHGTNETDWQAWFAAADTLGFSDNRHACGNPDCATLTDALFCSEACRELTEGHDHEDAFEREEHNTSHEPSGTDNGNLAAYSTKLSGVQIPAHHEAPASANTYITLGGRQVQLTLRDSDETRLLQRLEMVLRRFPVETPAQASTAPQPPQTPVCPYHGAMKESTKVSGTWFCPTKLHDGSGYCQSRWPAKGGARG